MNRVTSVTVGRKLVKLQRSSRALMTVPGVFLRPVQSGIALSPIEAGARLPKNQPRKLRAFRTHNFPSTIRPTRLPTVIQSYATLVAWFP
jgi:hypothetical protein